MPFKSKAQVSKCYAEKKKNPNSTWDCSAWAKETQNMKKLPNKKDVETTNAKEAFVKGFVNTCFALGITDKKEMTKLAKDNAAFIKNSEDGVTSAIFNGAGKALGHVTGLSADALKALALGGSIGLPFAVGAGTGHLLGGLRNKLDVQDLDAMRNEAIARAYRRKTDELRTRREAMEMEQNNPGVYKVLG